MAETQARGAWGINAAGSSSSAGAIEPFAGQRTVNVASIVETGTGVYAIQLFNPIPRLMGQIEVELLGVAGLTWRLVTWSNPGGLITIEIDTTAGVATASNFEFVVFQTNLDSAGGT